MKNYQKQRNVKSEVKGKLCPVLPEFASGDPAVDTVVYRWFDVEGKYLGWCDDETGRKFLYGKLYYKTKGLYQTKTKRSHSVVGARKIYIYEKGTHNLALYGARRVITATDLIDLNDKSALIKVTRDSIVKCQMSAWNLTDFPNPYAIIPLTMRKKFANDLDGFVKSKKQELIDYLNDYEKVLTEQRADEVALGVPIDI